MKFCSPTDMWSLSLTCRHYRSLILQILDDDESNTRLVSAVVSEVMGTWRHGGAKSYRATVTQIVLALLDTVSEFKGCRAKQIPLLVLAMVMKEHGCSSYCCSSRHTVCFPLFCKWAISVYQCPPLCSPTWIMNEAAKFSGMSMSDSSIQHILAYCGARSALRDYDQWEVYLEYVEQQGCFVLTTFNLSKRSRSMYHPPRLPYD